MFLIHYQVCVFFFAEVELASGFEHLRLPVPVPSMHILGAHDWSLAASKQLVEMYVDPLTYTTDEGHEIPMRLLRDVDLEAALANFFDRFTGHGGS